MNIRIADPSFQMIFLLEPCNLDCPHCVREEEPMAPGYRLSFDQFEACLADCRARGCVRTVHFSGGEPTLWREGSRDLVDLLIGIAAAGFTPSFVTNGTAFLDLELCRGFFRKYAEAAAVPIHIYMSIDTFHDNFDPAAGRAVSLDNLLRCREGLVEQLSVITVVSRAAETHLPESMVTHYESQGVRLTNVNLRGAGRARSMRDACPDRPDVEADTAGHLILIGDEYFVCLDLPDGGLDWRKVGKLGSDGILDSSGTHVVREWEDPSDRSRLPE